MTREEAQEYAKTMSYKEAVLNCIHSKGIAYRKASLIKLRELAEIADKLERDNDMTREETIKWLESLKAEIGKSEHRALWHYAEAIDMAIEALSADAVTFETQVESTRQVLDDFARDRVKVVRCKDCRWWEYVQGDGDCIRHTSDTLGYAFGTNAEDFCSFGERREP